MEQLKQQLQGNKDNEIPDLYVNSVIFGASLYDFMLKFGIQSDVGEIKSLLNIRMSPQHAKIMSIFFLRNIREYEKQFGQINLPKQLVKDYKLDEV